MFCGPAEHASEQIRRARHARWAAIEHVCVDHRGLHVAVAEQLLDRTDVGASLQQVRGKAMAKGMAACWLAYPCSAYSGMHRSLNHRWIQTIATLFTGVAIPPTRDLWKHPLPDPLARG